VEKFIAQTPGFSWGSGLSEWNNRTLLHIAAEQNNLGLIYKIVKEVGGLELGEEFFDATPTWYAAQSNNYEAVKILIALGAKVNVLGKHYTHGQMSVLEVVLTLQWEWDPIMRTHSENPRIGYPLCKLLVNRGARIRKDSLFTEKAEIFVREFSTEITATYEKCEEISVVFRQIFPAVNGQFISELQKLVLGYAFGPDDEGPAYDFIQVKALTEQRRRCISESPITQRAEAFFLELSVTQRGVLIIGSTLNKFVSRIVKLILAYDEGESYKEAH
jgi:hypothetical protein